MGPAVSVIVPTLDEERTVVECLRRIAAQDVAAETIEVLVVDGGSGDATVAVAERELASHNFAHAMVVGRGGDGSRPANLNHGLSLVQAPVVCRVDARSRIPPHYLRRCSAILKSRPDVMVVGGRQEALAASARALDVGIARALNNRWTMGGARYRRGAQSRAADTVYLGAFRTADLRAAGGWRIDFLVNEDFDLNRRLGRKGLVWFEADLTVGYVPRNSLPALLRQYVGFGRWKTRYWRLTGDRPRPRQLVLLGMPAIAAAAGGLAIVRSTPRRRVALAAGVVGGLAVVEVRGASGPPASAAGHVAGVAAMLCVGGGWLAGVWLEAAIGSTGKGRTR